MVRFLCLAPVLLLVWSFYRVTESHLVFLKDKSFDIWKKILEKLKMAFKIVCRESSGFCLCLDIKPQSLITNQKCRFIQMVGRTCLRFIFQKEASFWGWAVSHVSEHCNVLITSQNDTSSLNMFTFKTSGCKNRDSCWSVIGHISHQVQYVNVHILISTAVILNIYNNNWCYRGYANLQLPPLLQLFVPLVLMIYATWKLKHLFPLMD